MSFSAAISTSTPSILRPPVLKRESIAKILFGSVLVVMGLVLSGCPPAVVTCDSDRECPDDKPICQWTVYPNTSVDDKWSKVCSTACASSNASGDQILCDFEGDGSICVDEHCELVSVDPEPIDGGVEDAGIPTDGGSNGITILTFSAPAVVEAGEMTTLTWTTSNATSCEIFRGMTRIG
ncbi:MAG: hypothetical protein GY822_00255, partial [Deltaproteobacteria bacterium]|nr:hypothetical protein [Deltaproteobacteria bacterium]